MRQLTGTDLDGFRPMDSRQTVEQIGTGNVLAISGGRVTGTAQGLVLPVGAGYTVWIGLAPSDTYTVRRLFTRGGRTWIKGEARDVYAEQLGEVAYAASCFESDDFGGAA